MKPYKFDEIVTNRANERVDAKVRKFKQAVCDALLALTGVSNLGYSNPFTCESWKVYLLQIIKEKAWNEGWPIELWDKEKAAVSEELLKTMDEIQRALLAPSTASENTPQEPKEKATT